MPREPIAMRRVRAASILRRLKAEYPDSTISLEYGNAFQLVVAVILSAQCTDARVNIVTRDLFKKYRTVQDFARADLATLEKEIRSTGYFRAKSRNIRACARTVIDRFEGHVPDNMEDLVTLAGVGRKTANVVLWNGFGKSEGIAVDTHVTRVARRLRLTSHGNPEKIERDLVKVVDRADWGILTHVIIDHGRSTCVARRPRCERCVINELCPGAQRPRLVEGSIPNQTS